MFPVPKGVNQTSTMMGGWELAIPQTSKNKELTWELITLMVDPRLMSPWLKQTGFLPTQKSIGSGPELTQLNQAIPYYGDMVSMIPIGKSRPVASEYPQIAEHVRHAIEEVYYGIKQPKQALDDAAQRICQGFGMVRLSYPCINMIIYAVLMSFISDLLLVSIRLTSRFITVS